ncbi:TetR/AcrR family transcriptional regulator [Pseudonocardia sp. C8]|uniref:TetR/AcrR family transcriptional regulator n=1 Tax=Pseudonocardia sp. C8 TaxID=2762759 RepID=UPI001642BDFC|nr:TetR/AcrR family transcriptional regulator [Pseudonocardia sp. C8]MBC3192987.1 TetR/AcrR family transcriptional regulator [Pseudonocardia sp. C8]
MPRPPGHGSGFEPRRQEIISISASLFARRGYAATGITDICRAVGLARGALYYYIGSKENLLVEIQAAVLGPLLAVARRIVEAPASPAVRLRLLSEVLLDIIFQRLDHIWVYEHDYRQLSARNREVVVAQRHEFEAIVIDLLAAAVGEGQFRPMDLQLGMLQFLNLHNHTYQWARPGDEKWPVAHLAAEYCGTLFRGFASADFDPSGIEAQVGRFRSEHPELDFTPDLSGAAAPA